MKKTTIKREALFVRVTKANKTFLLKETANTKKITDSWVTTQDTVDLIVAGYRKLKKCNPRLAAKYF